MSKLFLAFFPIFLLAQIPSHFFIRTLQDQRVKNSPELLKYLTSSEASERELALLAIANIQDSSAFHQVVLRLHDSSSAVRAMAAFALGRFSKREGVAALFQRLSVEKNERCIAEMLNAIGMCGSADDLDSLISFSQAELPAIRFHVTNAMRRFAVRRINTESAYSFLATALKDSATVEPAVYSLMRYDDSLIVQLYGEQILPLLHHQSPSVRMWSASILSNSSDEKIHRALLNAAISDHDWRVRVNAIRALRGVRSHDIKENIFSLLRDTNEHVALTALATIEAINMTDPRFSDSAKYVAVLHSKGYRSIVKEEMKKVLALKIRERALPFIGEWKSDDPYITALRIRAVGETKSPTVVTSLKQELKQTKHSMVAIAAIEALRTIVQTSVDSLKNEFLHAILFQFARKDPGIAYTIAGVFQDSMFSREMRRRYLPSLVSEYLTMNVARDLEPMIELLNVFTELADSSALPAVEKGLAEQESGIRSAAEKAYKAITGNNSPIQFIRTAETYKPFYTLEDLNLLKRYAGADVITTKGTIRIMFEKEAAPFTVLNFILLAQRKFYDGLSFHRVVSNFVIQGGDPFGNGSGGPNYTIRTEVHPEVTYKTGAVGMASAGKDTEGSQWFVTHSPTPHLDFRYTVFGYTKDSTVVDKIMVGDRIKKVVLF
ncbi:MAG: peptidylprolyl isomerase [Bacteroidota bacterium]